MASDGMLTNRVANNALLDASRSPNPDELYHSLWYEGEVGYLFTDSNLGKSIYAVQIAKYVAQERPILYLDCELSQRSSSSSAIPTKTRESSTTFISYE